MSDYERIAGIIEFLDRHHSSQPSVTDLANVAGLSESHLHRLFRKWCGTTPKAFLKCLTIEHAKTLLDESASVFDAAIDSGLSGPGRLHDLFVTLESITPGEYKSKGTGVELITGHAPTPFGECSIAWTARGICHLEFPDYDSQPSSSVPVLPAHWRNASVSRDDALAADLAARVFSGSASDSRPLNLLVHGSDFQIKVWKALLQIPAGSLTSYNRVAAAINSAGASRAVGTACGSNPIAYLIPCHRVIRQTGIVQGYRWGDTRKKALLAHEYLD